MLVGKLSCQRAKLLCYAWGGANAAEFNELLRHADPEQAIAVNVSSLLEALIMGWNRVADTINARPDTVARVVLRGEQIFGILSRK